MVDIQSVAAEIRRGKKEDRRRRRKKLQGKNIMAPYYIGRGHNKTRNIDVLSAKCSEVSLIGSLG